MPFIEIARILDAYEQQFEELKSEQLGKSSLHQDESWALIQRAGLFVEQVGRIADALETLAGREDRAER